MIWNNFCLWIWREIHVIWQGFYWTYHGSWLGMWDSLGTQWRFIGNIFAYSVFSAIFLGQYDLWLCQWGINCHLKKYGRSFWELNGSLKNRRKKRAPNHGKNHEILHPKALLFPLVSGVLGAILVGWLSMNWKMGIHLWKLRSLVLCLRLWGDCATLIKDKIPINMKIHMVSPYHHWLYIHSKYPPVIKCGKGTCPIYSS